MHYCNKCGATIVDISKPCPVCGMYLQNNNSNINENGKKRFNINIIFLIGVFISIILVVGLTNKNYLSKISEYSNDEYRVKYLDSKWTKSTTTNDEFLVLKYNGTDAYLVFPDTITNFALNMNDEEIRKSLYNAYINEFKNSISISYSNIMPDIEELKNTRYYYLTSDFKDKNNDDRGKAFFIHDGSGKCLTLLLVLDDTNISVIENDVFNIIETLEM